MVNWNWVVMVDPDAVTQDTTRTIRRFIPYPSAKYGIYLINHDLMLVELADRIDLQGGMKRAAVLPTGLLSENATCMTYGWLYTSILK